MLQARKIYSNTMSREDAQEIADENQRPVVIMTYTPPVEVGIPTKERPRLRLRVLPKYRYMDDIRKRNAASGGHWFEPATMRFFSSRVQESVYGAKDGRAYFVTSERPPDGRRAYSVRVAGRGGEIETVGEFMGFRTGRAAHRAAKAAAEGVDRG